MEINKRMDGTTLLVAIIGRLDTTTAPNATASIEEESGYTDIRFDFSSLDYISSSGLRMLFFFKRKLGGKEHVVVENANNIVRDIFSVSGFDKQITVL